MGLVLHGIGTAVPEGRVTQDEALQCAKRLSPPEIRSAPWLPAIYEHSEIRTRHQTIGRPLVDDLLNGTRNSNSPFLPAVEGSTLGPTTGERMRMYADEAPRLALRAAADALTESRFPPDSIDHLLTISCTGFAAPGVDLALIRELGLRPTVQRTQIGFMGCHAAINGLRVANAFASAEPSARVLAVAVELCSLHYSFAAEPDRVVANAIFADGSAAVVGSGAGDGWRVRATGSHLIPGTADEMHWRIGDHGFEMKLSRRVADRIGTHLRPALANFLGGHGLALTDVPSWAIHPGGPRIVAAVVESLGLMPAASAVSREVFAEYGNMSSATLLFVLDRLRRSNAPRPCVGIGFGPGLIAEMVLFE